MQNISKWDFTRYTKMCAFSNYTKLVNYHYIVCMVFSTNNDLEGMSLRQSLLRISLELASPAPFRIRLYRLGSYMSHHVQCWQLLNHSHLSSLHLPHPLHLSTSVTDLSCCLLLYPLYPSGLFKDSVFF